MSSRMAPHLSALLDALAAAVLATGRLSGYKLAVIDAYSYPPENIADTTLYHRGLKARLTLSPTPGVNKLDLLWQLAIQVRYCASPYRSDFQRKSPLVSGYPA